MHLILLLALCLYFNFCGSLASPSSSLLIQPKRPFELEVLYNNDLSRDIYSDIDTSPCLLSSLKTTQIHRGVDDISLNVIYRTGYLFGEPGSIRYLRAFSYNKQLLYEEAQKLCGTPGIWSFSEVTHLSILDAYQVQQDIPEKQTYLKDVKTEACSSGCPYFETPSPPQLEILPLSRSGIPSNRIDLVFFSDGYTIDEREKFFSDAARLALDISNNQTFASVKPLLNFWAAFSPSLESGIGTGGKPKNTTYGLYRDGSELRGVYYSKPEVAHAACLSMGDQCDYPILLGNDPFYGGLGGRYTVVTSSIENGALVLRHELGHSIIDVGEEYDGGYSYFGVNASPNVTSALSWSHWLTSKQEQPHSERSVMALQSYPWTFLNTTDPWRAKFSSSGEYDRYLVRFSLSGIPQKNHLKILLDDEELDWSPRVDIGLDRWHYDIYGQKAILPGEHVLSFSLSPEAIKGKAQLCSIEVLEFGDSSEFNNSPGYIGAFPTYSEHNVTTYRPTNEGCLMRVVTNPDFCSVCLEGLWLHLLARVSLIDDLEVGCFSDGLGKSKLLIEVYLVPLAQFRREITGTIEEVYAITWKRDDIELSEFTNKTVIDPAAIPGRYEVQVNFFSNEIRKDDGGLTSDSMVIDLTILSSECILS